MKQNYDSKNIVVLEGLDASDDDHKKIYANILIEDINLFADANFKSYYTSVLRNQAQSSSDSVADSLDLLKTVIASGATDSTERADFENYYFSGLSFSVKPTTGKTASTYSELPIITADNKKQLAVSLCVLELDESDKTGGKNGTWKIHQPAYLPKIEHGTTEDSIVVTGDTLLKSDLTVNGETELVGDALLKSNLTVEDNINVGSLTDEERATTDNGGYIVAKKDITAMQDLIAKQDITADNDLTVGQNATIKTSLVVGERDATDSSDAGVLTVKDHIKTPTLNASTSVTAPYADITEAEIGSATVTTLTVPFGSASDSTSTVISDTGINTPFIEAENLKADGLAIGDTITIVDDENKDVTTVGDVIWTKNTVTADTSMTAPEITATDALYQNNGDRTMKVPIIELIHDGDYFQLQISRIGEKASN